MQNGSRQVLERIQRNINTATFVHCLWFRGSQAFVNGR
ncbi:hypothetical protein NIES2104_24630 [Leptolyngbya sp. NIES-2104]|nr:hypothetical protein NIES2104_24630 [Leptolyngbya sp. NIES-2104]